MGLSAVTSRLHVPIHSKLNIADEHARGLLIFSPFDQPANRVPNLAPMRARTQATDGVFVGSLAPGIGRFGPQIAVTAANYLTYTNPGVTTSYSFLYAFYMTSTPSGAGWSSNFILGPFSPASAYDWGLYASGSTDKLVFFPTKQADTPATVTAAAAVTTYTPYVVIGTFNSVTGTAELIINGVSQGTADNTGKTPGNANTLYIGYDWASTAQGMPTNGFLFAFWNRALPRSEAAEITYKLRDIFAPAKPPLIMNVGAGGGGGGGSEGAALHHWLQAMGAR